jgi:hypothetical protein
LRRLSNTVIFLGYTTNQEVLEIGPIQEAHPSLYFFSGDHYAKSGKPLLYKRETFNFPL